MKPVECSDVRYIKLARGGRWVDAALDGNELHFGYRDVPHDLALKADAKSIRSFCVNMGHDQQRAAEIARQVFDFYTLGSTCLWITFARDHLWWGFAELEVTWRGRSEARSHGERTRKIIGGWKNADVHGEPLKTVDLSTALTSVANYRQTICGVRVRDYLLRRINGQDEPLILAANKARAAMVETLAQAIQALSWSAFELLVDLIFARSGWLRTSTLGGRQKDIDLALEQAATGERIAVQVKSRASQRTLEEYISRIDRYETYDRLFFVCHSPKGTIAAPGDRDDVVVWSGIELAERAMKTGLQDWILERNA